MTRITAMIRSLLIGALVAHLFAAPQRAHADEAAAIEAVEKAGGTVRTIAKDSPDKEAAFHLSSAEVTDESLSSLKEIEGLVWLNLRGTKVTDAGLAQLAELKGLKRLHLEKTAVTDAGLAHLAGLENLEYLNLYGTQVTDAGLKHLEGLSNLKKLYLWQTEVTKDGAEQLQTKLTDLYINRGADAEPGPPTKALAMGRYVKVRLEGEKRILSIAELQIIETATGKELQTEGSAIQSSLHGDGKAERAIDGNVDGVYDKGSVTHTNESTSPWLLVDLGDTKDIGKLVIHNRADCCGDRLKDAIVEIFDVSLSVVYTGKVTEATDGSVTELVAE